MDLRHLDLTSPRAASLLLPAVNASERSCFSLERHAPHSVSLADFALRLPLAPPFAGDAPAEVAVHRPIDVQPYPIRLVNWFMSK